MAKNPAVLFYTSDFLVGTSDLMWDEKGRYIHLLCLQHQKGHLTERQILIEMGILSLDDISEVMDKFEQDENGDFYNDRMDEEINKRKKYLVAQSENGKKGGAKTQNKNACRSDNKQEGRAPTHYSDSELSTENSELSTELSTMGVDNSNKNKPWLQKKQVTSLGAKADFSADCEENGENLDFDQNKTSRGLNLACEKTSRGFKKNKRLENENNNKLLFPLDRLKKVLINDSLSGARTREQNDLLLEILTTLDYGCRLQRGVSIAKTTYSAQDFITVAGTIDDAFVISIANKLLKNTSPIKNRTYYILATITNFYFNNEN